MNALKHHSGLLNFVLKPQQGFEPGKDLSAAAASMLGAMSL